MILLYSFSFRITIRYQGSVDALPVGNWTQEDVSLRYLIRNGYGRSMSRKTDSRGHFSHFCWFEGQTLHETIMEMYIFWLKRGVNHLPATNRS